MGLILSVSRARGKKSSFLAPWWTNLVTPKKQMTHASSWASGRSFGIIYMGLILSVSRARAQKSCFLAPWWPNLVTPKKTNDMCIIVGFRPIFWYNIHGVDLVRELSNGRGQRYKHTYRIAYYCHL